MKIDPAHHRRYPWRVHTLAKDFELLDVWELPITGAPADRFDRFFELVTSNALEMDNAIARALFALRAGLGKIFRWDESTERPIPGCVETTLVARLSDHDRSQSSVEPGFMQKLDLADVRHVYRFANEALLEISNATIHALLHLSWAKTTDGRARVAIYIKSRGAMSRIYMAMIEPFRMLFVYPSWTKKLTRAYEASFIAKPIGTQRASA